MKSSPLFAGAVSLALIACKDIPQAPPEVPPPSPAFATIVIDSQFGADYDHAIRYPSIALSGTTTLNLLYGLEETGQLRYAGCPIACDEKRNWHIGTPDAATAGDFVGTGIAGARLHAAFQAWRPAGYPAYLKYASCPGLCDRPANWVAIEIDTVGNTGWNVSLATDPEAGSLHVAYLRYANPMQLMYASCSTGCGTAARWTLTAVDTAQAFGETQIVRTPSGALHVVYEVLDRNGMVPRDLKYATCSSDCAQSTSWQTRSLGAGRLPSLGTSSDGRLTLAYIDGSDALQLATCSLACTTPGPWPHWTLVDSAALVTDVALQVAPDGDWHVAYADRREPGYGVVHYVTCHANCADSRSWRSLTLDSAQYPIVYFVALAVDSTKRVSIAHATSGALRVSTIYRIPE